MKILLMINVGVYFIMPIEMKSLLMSIKMSIKGGVFRVEEFADVDDRERFSTITIKVKSLLTSIKEGVCLVITIEVKSLLTSIKGGVFRLRWR